MRCLLIHKPILHKIFEYLPIISQMSFKRAIHPDYRKNLPNIYNCCRERLVVLLDKHFQFENGYDGKQIMQHMETHQFSITHFKLMSAILNGNVYIKRKSSTKRTKLMALSPYYRRFFGGWNYRIDKKLLTVRHPRELVQSVPHCPPLKSFFADREIIQIPIVLIIIIAILFFFGRRGSNDDN